MISLCGQGKLEMTAVTLKDQSPGWCDFWSGHLPRLRFSLWPGVRAHAVGVGATDQCFPLSLSPYLKRDTPYIYLIFPLSKSQ